MTTSVFTPAASKRSSTLAKVTLVTSPARPAFSTFFSRDLIGRLHARGLIGTGRRSPQRGAPYTYVTTEQLLVSFGLESLRDLPDRDQLVDAGAVGEAPQVDFG